MPRKKKRKSLIKALRSAGNVAGGALFDAGQAVGGAARGLTRRGKTERIQRKAAIQGVARIKEGGIIRKKTLKKHEDQFRGKPISAIFAELKRLEREQAKKKRK